MPPFQTHNLPLLKNIPCKLKIAGIYPSPLGGFWVTYDQHAVVSKFDVSFNLVWEKDLQFPVNEYHVIRLSISPDEELFAISGKNEISIYNKEATLIHIHSHPSWDSFCGANCHISSPDETGRRLIWLIEPSSTEISTLKVIDTANFEQVTGFPYIPAAEISIFYPTPHRNKVFIELVFGPEGNQLSEVELKDRKLILSQFHEYEDRIMGSFSSSGTEFVTALYTDTAIEIFSFPLITGIASIAQKTIFEESNEYPPEKPDSIDFRIFYLSPKTMIAQTRFGRILLLDRNSLTCIGELSLKPTFDPDEIENHEGKIIYMTPLANEFILIWHSSNSLKIYQLPDNI